MTLCVKCQKIPYYIFSEFGRNALDHELSLDFTHYSQACDFASSALSCSLCAIILNEFRIQNETIGTSEAAEQCALTLKSRNTVTMAAWRNDPYPWQRVTNSQ